MTLVRFISADGDARAARSRRRAGERLLDVAQAAGQPLEGHVRGADGLLDLPRHRRRRGFREAAAASEEEEDMLDLAAHVTRHSRLSCQIWLTEALETLTVRMPGGAQHAGPMTAGALICGRSRRPYAPRESGGRRSRQPGQVRKEAAVTISLRVVPAPTSPSPTACRARRAGASRSRPRVPLMPAAAGMSGAVRLSASAMSDPNLPTISSASASTSRRSRTRRSPIACSRANTGRRASPS